MQANYIRSLFFLTPILVIVAVLSGCSAAAKAADSVGGNSSPTANSGGISSQNVTENVSGQTLYQNNCFSCHSDTDSKIARISHGQSLSFWETEVAFMKSRSQSGTLSQRSLSQLSASDLTTLIQYLHDQN